MTVKKRMEQLTTGKFEYIVPQIRLSEEEITITVPEMSDYQGEFFFGAEDSSVIKGMLFSDNRRIILSRDSFSGNAISVFYRIDTKGLVSGDECTGNVTVCSSLGEVKIAFKIVILAKEVKTSQGNLRDLGQFAALAENNYKEAFRLYTKDSFKQLLKNENIRYEELYRGLSKSPVTYQNMEEFLIATGQKEAIEISVDETKRELLNLESSLKDTIYINKNTWGHLRLEVEATGGFLSVEKKVITAEDFIGSVYSLEYVISREALKGTKHHGKIYIKGVYETLIVEIVASSVSEYEINNHRFEKALNTDMARDYLMLQVKKLEYGTWKERMVGHLDELKEAGCFAIKQRLYEVYMYYIADNAPKTLDTMLALKGQVFTPDEYEEEGLYLYLGKQTGLITSKDIDVVARIDKLYRKNQDSFVLLWLLIHASGEFAKNPTKQLFMLERQYEIGCNSPFLYLEAIKLIIANESLLKKLSPFMIQTLNFARKYDMLTEQMVMRITYLSIHEKQFSENLYRTLEECYYKHPSKDVLETVCKYIMLGNPRREKYFKWYQLGVEEDVRITRLYEFYVETFDRHEQISLPQEVKLYFAYNNTLGNNKKAFVYANIIKDKDRDPQMYQKYVEIIKDFTKKSLVEHKINEDYAVIYQEILEQIEDKETANYAARVAFTHRLYCDDSKIRNVIVRHGQLVNERVYPCIDKVAFIDIYTEDAQIIFEDAHHQRFVSTVDYNQQKLFDNKKIIEQCLWQDVADDGLLLNICGGNLRKTEANVRNLGSLGHITLSEGFTKEYRQEARHKLLGYYDQHAEDRTINEYLSKIDYQEFYKTEPEMMLDILVRRNFTSEAFALVCDLGYEKISVTTLFKLCRTLIIETEFIENEELTSLAYFCLIRDKYDSVILSYLQDNYIGTVEEMMKINEKLAGFDLDTYDISEEILLLAMYSRVYHPELSAVLENYTARRGKASIIKAFLAFLSYGYFIGDIRIDSYVFKSLEELFENDQEDDIITSLALLKRYRYCHKLTDEQQANVVKIMEKCREENLRFALFAQLPRECTKTSQVQDKIFIEEVVSPQANVTLHYSLGREGEEPKYVRETLTHHYHGIFTREFLLFYGEQLDWYMTIVSENEKRETPKETILMNHVTKENGSKYQMLNQMLADRRLNREEMLETTMDKYLRQEYFIASVFELID